MRSKTLLALISSALLFIGFTAFTIDKYVADPICAEIVDVEYERKDSRTGESVYRVTIENGCEYKVTVIFKTKRGGEWDSNRMTYMPPGDRQSNTYRSDTGDFFIERVRKD